LRFLYKKKQQHIGTVRMAVRISKIYTLTQKRRNPVTITITGFPIGRSGGIRTRGLLVPNQARYQASPRPDDSFTIIWFSSSAVKWKLPVLFLLLRAYTLIFQ
jgi:hypothetical protein